MPPAANSPEFQHLATRWLDGAASAADVARLWSIIMASDECAQEFADLARFELLLEDTLREAAREAPVQQVARTVQRQVTTTRYLRIAAVIGLLGVISWLVLPQGLFRGHQDDLATGTPPVAKPIANAPARRTLAASSMIVQAPAAPTTAAVTKPLPQRLDDFFLTGIDIDHKPLGEALAMIEAQLRALNFGHAAALDRLHVSLPAAASTREITFRSGAISFMKAVRAMAALAGCNVDATDSGIVLLLQSAPRNLAPESQGLEALMASTNSAPLLREHVIADARSLGMTVDDATNTLIGTRSQFDALNQLLAARRQIQALPPLSLLAFGNKTDKPATDEVLDERKAKAALDQAQATGMAVLAFTLSQSAGLQEDLPTTGAPNATPDYRISARPAGEDGRTLITLDPTSDFLAAHNSDGIGAPETTPLDVLPESGGGWTTSLAGMSDRPVGLIGDVGRQAVVDGPSAKGAGVSGGTTLANGWLTNDTGAVTLLTDTGRNNYGGTMTNGILAITSNNGVTAKNGSGTLRLNEATPPAGVDVTTITTGSAMVMYGGATLTMGSLSLNNITFVLQSTTGSATTSTTTTSDPNVTNPTNPPTTPP